jgi:Tol biopolymer transport system component
MTLRFPNLPLQFVVLTSIASVGCVPTVVWLPDSSGIIYTTTDWPGLGDGGFTPKELQGRLIQYDLKKKSARIIAKAETNTLQPALSPNGKQIAVARINLEKDKQSTLVVVVYDLTGKEIQRSKPFDWGGVPKSDTDLGIQKYSQLFWAPHENKVLVYANKLSGIYDLGKDRVVMLGEAVPSIFGTTPIRRAR